MTDNKQPSAGIVGGGAVGKAIASYFPSAKIYDKYKPADPIEEVVKSDFIFGAVPTPFGEAPDLVEMDDAIKNLASRIIGRDDQAVIIKSTVVPGTTDRYQSEYPDINFIFNPEFLTERTASEDFLKPDKQLVGYTLKSKPIAEKVLAILPPAPYAKTMAAKTAEAVKYAINSFYAFKVIFANTVYEVCQKTGTDYDALREALVRDARIIDSHFDVAHGGYRGYGGKCLPKDVKTLAWFGRQYGFQPKFIETIIALNEKLLKDKHL